MTRLLLGVLATAALVSYAGCSPPKIESDVIANAQLEFDAGSAASEKEDYVTAQQHLTRAIEAGGLNPDLLVDAYLQLAVAEAHMSNFDAAHAALDQASQGAADMRSVYRTRALVYQRQGNTKEAKKAQAQAVR